MALHLVKMNFSSPLHLAKGGIDYGESQERLHSDTLKSAIFTAARHFYEAEITAGQTADANPFLDAFDVSSAFPFFQGELFFPRPMRDVRFFAEKDAAEACKNLDAAACKKIEDEVVKTKVAKKVKYLGQSLFEKYLAGSPAAIPNSQLFQENKFASEKLTRPENVEDLIFTKDEPFQHVTVPRAGDDDSVPFYMERLRFAEGAGLFFLLKIRDERFSTMLKAALNLLGDEGVGSDRTTGNGQFEPEWIENFQFKTLDAQAGSATQWLNLSLFCPTRDEFDSPNFIEHSAYKLVRRGGYVASPENYSNATLRKKPVYFFEEGSVFPLAPADLRGKLMDVRPGIMANAHPVYRDGRSLFLPIFRS